MEEVMSKPYRYTPHITIRTQTTQANKLARKIEAHSRGEYCEDNNCERCLARINARLEENEHRHMQKVHRIMSERIAQVY